MALADAACGADWRLADVGGVYALADVELPDSLMPRRGALPTEQYAALREQVHELHGWRCLLCGQRASDRNPLQVHHVVKRSRGGQDRIEELAPLHAWGCHPAMDRNGWKIYRGLLEARIAAALERNAG